MSSLSPPSVAEAPVVHRLEVQGGVAGALLSLGPSLTLGLLAFAALGAQAATLGMPAALVASSVGGAVFARRSRGPEWRPTWLLTPPALLALCRTLGAEVLARHSHAGFNVRVDIPTGSVLLGGGLDAEATFRGSAVNIAARMEQTAPPGGLRISRATYARVRGLVEVHAQVPLAIKGVQAPVASYLVQRAKPRQFRIGQRGIEGVATRCLELEHHWPGGVGLHMLVGRC